MITAYNGKATVSCFMEIEYFKSKIPILSLPLPTPHSPLVSTHSPSIPAGNCFSLAPVEVACYFASMNRIYFLLVLLLFSQFSYAQSVGIGTNDPDPKAVLDISSSSKGVLFPRMTTIQRDAIVAPPDGLHIYNTTERGLNYYDSVYGIWNSYLDAYKTAIIHITSSNFNVDFYEQYAKYKVWNRYLVIINQGVSLLGEHPSDTALIFSKMPEGVSIKVRNYGFIGGAGGSGGSGRRFVSTASPCFVLGSNIPGTDGEAGGPAIATRPGVMISVVNYGFIAGGGGGGGAGSTGPSGNGYGGGGGGGAGTTPGAGGAAGMYWYYSNGLPPGCRTSLLSSPGSNGGISNGGAGGLGSVPPESLGGTGGNGGARGMPGQPGSDGMFQGGAAGKAIAGGSGNTLVNAGSGQSLGAVD
jgi:hypothetical protein